MARHGCALALPKTQQTPAYNSCLDTSALECCKHLRIDKFLGTKLRSQSSNFFKGEKHDNNL